MFQVKAVQGFKGFKSDESGSDSDSGSDDSQVMMNGSFINDVMQILSFPNSYVFAINPPPMMSHSNPKLRT